MVAGRVTPQGFSHYRDLFFVYFYLLLSLLSYLRKQLSVCMMMYDDVPFFPRVRLSVRHVFDPPAYVCLSVCHVFHPRQKKACVAC